MPRRLCHFEPTKDRTATLKKARHHLARRDPVLRQVIARVGPCTLHPAEDRFRALTRSIISQQISTHAAAAIAGRLEQLLSRTGITARSLGRLSADQLRAAGLSAAKIQCLQSLAEDVRKGLVTLYELDHLTDEDVISKLTPLRGIGRWTAEMFLIFSLGRLDVLPVADFGLRAGIRRYYKLSELPGRDYLNQLGESWRPYRSIATWYIWRSLGVDLKKR
jgi:DNA-3-methyladenine glycosylase II